MTALRKERMTVNEFLAWAERQPERFELLDGVPVAMSPERAIHGLTSHRVASALDRAIVKTQAPCHFLPDSVAVRIDETTSLQPDAMVYCGARVSGDTIEVNTPVIVVEVLSPSTATKDLRDKLVGYFRLPSVHHYLIVDPDRRVVIHHKRGGGDLIETRIASEGSMRLDPPGLEVLVQELFEQETSIRWPNGRLMNRWVSLRSPSRPLWRTLAHPTIVPAAP
jgi:Uma2 family endonuclease